MELAIAAIFQNEAPYLKEWIDFHRLIGFEYFDLFDHMSTDSPETVLKPYIEQGVVRLTRWPFAYNNVYEWTEIQCLAYERAAYGSKSKWLAILDVDEFLFPAAGELSEILKSFEDFGGVSVNWQIYGTSNISKIPEGKLLIETLNWKAPKLQAGNHHVKSIIRPERIQGFDNAHSATYKDGFYQVNTKKQRFEGALSPSVEIDLLRINHYTLRDQYYLVTHKIPRLEKWWPKERKSVQAWTEKFAPMNLVEDRAIHRFFAKNSQTP